MNYKLMFTVNALFAFVLGVALLFAPVMMLGVFNAEEYKAFQFLAQFFGFAMISFGLLLWFTKEVSDEKIEKEMGYALFASSVLGLIVALLATFHQHALLREKGWIPILIYLLFALGYAYLLFMKPKSNE